MLSKRFLFLSKLSNAQGTRCAIQRTSRRNRRHTDSLRQPANCRVALETLEDRLLLSAAPIAQPPATPVAHTTFKIEGRLPAPGSAQPTTSASPQQDLSLIDPAQMESAYGVNLIEFGSIQGTGKGETIALIDAYNDPDIISDANSFSSYYNLPQFNGSGEPTLQVLNQTGGTNLSGVGEAAGTGWDVEESLDVEWAHSIAPQANIILFEGNTDSLTDLLTADKTAGKTTGVVAASNSWSSSEFSGEQSFDSDFTTPSGHPGVTFLASTGDSGPPSGYPAYSPNVVAVGGTSLYLDGNASYLGESVWGNLDYDGAGSGGISQFESQPGYQAGKVNSISATSRTVPDISLDADPSTGVPVLDSDSGGWFQVGGTSLSSPMMGAVISIADQGRALNGQGSLDGATQTLPALYSLPSADFHDITTGISNDAPYATNGYAAAPGYDLATGIGSPIANNLVTALAGYQPSPPATVSAPLTISVSENSSFTFSGGSINATDASATGVSDSLSLAVSNGTLTLGSLAGLTFDSGGNNTSSVTVTGTVANLDAALNNLVYAPTSGYLGSDALQVSVEDANNSLTGWATVDITVNPGLAPAITAPYSVATGENHPFLFANTLTVNDSVASGASDAVSLSVYNGKLTLGSTSGVLFTSGSNGSASMTMIGTLANLDAALTNLEYTPNSSYTGSDWLQMSVADSGDVLSDADVVALTVNPAPSVKVPAPVTVSENSQYTFLSSSISLTDTAASGTSDSLTLSVTDGTLTLASTTGVSVTAGSNGSSSMTVTGTLANLNAAVNGLIYTPNTNYLGTDSLQISAMDSGDNLTGSGAVSISVVTPPSVTAPANVSLNENATYTFSGSIALVDPSLGTGKDSLSLSVADGKLTLASTNGITISSGSNGSSSMTVTGTLTNLNAAVNGLVYTPNNAYSGSDALNILIKDPGDNLSGPGLVAITVNPLGAPVVTAPPSASTNENTAYTFSSGAISVTDASASGTSDSLSVSVTDGTLTLGSTSGLTFASGSNDTSSMTVTGTLTNLNAALAGLVYAPNSAYSGTDSLKITVKDSGDNLQGPATVSLTVNPVPTVLAPGAAFVTENATYVFSGGSLSVLDAAASGTSDSVTLSVTDGTLTLGSTTGVTVGPGSNSSASMTITGTLANLNAALNGLVYTPNSNYTGGDSLQISLSDSGDGLSGLGKVAITVGNFPPPTITAPSSASVNENGILTFSSSISVTDSVASGTSDSFTLSVANGKLTLGSTTGLTISTGSNNSSAMTINGTLANLNAALKGLTYTPTTGYSGHDSLKISVSDSGDNQSNAGSVAIAVNPFVTAPATASVLENATYAFSSSAADPISLTDGAASGTSESLTVSVLHGKLTLASTTGLTFSSGSNGSSTMTVKGTLASLNAALNGLVYAPQTTYTGSDTLTITVGDSGDSLSGSASVAITVALKHIMPAVATLGSSSPMVDDQDQDQDQDAVQWAGVSAAVDVLND
jgi:hypothetical protein